MIESKEDLLDELRKLSAAWRTRGARKSIAALGQAWPPFPIMTTSDWAHLLETLKKVRSEGSGEITEPELGTLNEAIVLLEAWIYRC